MSKEIMRIETETMGMPIEQWTYESCLAQIGTGDDWATIYLIKSEIEGKGHATTLLKAMKEYYTAAGKEFGSTVALNKRMSYLLKLVGIVEYV